MQGLLLVNKPEGITSFKVVYVTRKLADTKKVGHTGTLDPLATGVLPILIGRATSLCPYLLNADKRYIATVKTGIVTDTLDITGKVIGTKEANFTIEDLNKAILAFTGELRQYPPMFSAIKKDGVPLYKLARKGQEIEVERRKINIFSIKLLDFNEKDKTFSIDVHCSKGTYIRSLCRDLGEYLGCGATMTSLKRTATGAFTLEQCIDLDSLNKENICENILSEELAVSHLPTLFVSEKQAFRFSNGGKLSFERLNQKVEDGQYLRVKYKDTFIGIGYADGEKKEIRIMCLINPIKEAI